MWNVLTCLTQQHDWRLVLFAGLICLVATLTSFRLYSRAGKAGASARKAWLAFIGITAGAGTWATHFVAMLAYRPPFRTGYLPLGTYASLGFSVIGAAIGFGLADQGRRRRDWSLVVLGGVVVGLGVVLMHFTGMSAFRTEGDIRWDLPTVVSAVLISCAFSAAALFAAGDCVNFKQQASGAAVLTLAICGLHFTAMGAVTIVPDPTVAVPPRIIPDAVLAGLVCALVALIILGGFGAVVIGSASGQDAHRQLDRALGAISEGLAVYDGDDRLVVWNDKYFEYEPQARSLAKVGTTFRQLLECGMAVGCYPDAAGREQEWIEERIAGRRAKGRVLLQRNRDDRWFRIEERPSGDGVVSVIVDVTDLKRDAEALARARDAADAANRAKSVFLSNMSHELRTPLNGVTGLAHALARMPMPPEQATIVTEIRRSAAALEQLVSDLLDLAQVEQGRLDLKQHRFHVGETVRAAAAIAQAQARAKGLDMVTAIHAEAETWADGDDLKLTQILGNLLSNAVKFTDRGSIALDVDRSPEGAIVFRVTDTGVGFAPEQASRLFERFERLDDTLTRRFGGGGVGLAISRELARAMGGDLTGEGRPGEGSTFQLTLPLARCTAASADSADTIAARPTAVGARSRVMVVDDHPLNRQVLQLMLRDSGSDISGAENGQGAVDLYLAEPFDLILMDIQMPVMDGLTAVRRIRALETERNLPAAAIVMVSANALPEHLEASYAAGADAHVAKPVNPTTLFAAIERALTPKGSRAAA